MEWLSSEWPDEFGRGAHYVMLDENGQEFPEWDDAGNLGEIQ